MSNTPLVSIVIINWNGGEVFHECLASIEKLACKNYEVIVVDNGSIDGTQKLATIKNSTNLGFAHANNQGYALSKGKYVLLLNNDTLVQSDLLNILVNFLENNSDVGVVQPKIRIMDKPDLLDNCGSFMTVTGFLQHWGYLQHDGSEFNQTKEIFSAKGACMFIRREVIDKIGLFDNDFVSYFEESDFCWRVWLAGWRVVYYPKTDIFHKVGFTSKRLDPIGVNYVSFRNRLCSLIKNLEVSSFYILFIHITLIKGLALYYLFRGQFAKSTMIWRAMVWNVVNLSGSLAKRKTVQSLRHKSDSRIFKKVLTPLNWREMFIHFQRVERDLG